MKPFFILSSMLLFCLLLVISLDRCSNEEKNEDSNMSESEVITSNNFYKMNDLIDKAVAKGDYAVAFNVLNAMCSHFDKNSKIVYNSETGEIGQCSYKVSERFTSEQYCRKAVSVLKAESEVLLTKNDSEAENLFLEHLGDFDLGVNNVYLGKFSSYNDENESNEKYQKAVTIYNDYLISVIRKALVKNNIGLANKISLLVRDGLSFTKEEDGRDYKYIWSYDTEAKDEAKELISSFNNE
ncbi:MAG: hypothetical protein K2N05_12050 [Muribaculaceae bacterium]|nr:hypothetical protein [Muribaculaceae bacterium]